MDTEKTGVTIALETKLSRDGDILYAPVNAEEAVMLSISAGHYFGQFGCTRIWQLLEAPMTVAQICARLCEEFEVDAQHCKMRGAEFRQRIGR